MSGTTPSTITLAWDGDPTKSYDVLRSGVKIATVTGITYTNEGLLPNTPYIYAIRGNGVTTPNSTFYVSGSTSGGSTGGGGSNTPIVGPSNLHVNSKTNSTITLAWDGDLNQTYDILRSDVKIATVTGTIFTDGGLLPNTPYIYSVRASGVTTPKITVTIP